MFSDAIYNAIHPGQSITISSVPILQLVLVVASNGVLTYVANTMVRFAGPSKWRNPAMKDMFVKHASVWGLPPTGFRLCAGCGEVLAGLLMLCGWVPNDVCEGLCLCGIILLVCIMTGATMTQAALGNGWKGMQNSVWFSFWTVLAGLVRAVAELEQILFHKPLVLDMALGMAGFTTLLGTLVMLSGFTKRDVPHEDYLLQVE